MLKSNNLCIVFLCGRKEENTLMVKAGHTCGRRKQSGLSKLVRSSVEGESARLCAEPPPEYQNRASHQDASSQSVSRKARGRSTRTTATGCQCKSKSWCLLGSDFLESQPMEQATVTYSDQTAGKKMCLFYLASYNVDGTLSGLSS